MTGDVPDWRVYERVATCFEMESAGMDVSISRVKRQIDILVDARWDEGIARCIIYDAKRRRRKINVNDVESFEGMMKDVQASRGVLICSNGWTETALGPKIDIRLMIVEEVDDIDHAATDPCPYCQSAKRKQKGIVFWDGQFPSLSVGGRSYSRENVMLAEASRSSAGSAARKSSFPMMRLTNAVVNEFGLLKKIMTKCFLSCASKTVRCLLIDGLDGELAQCGETCFYREFSIW